MRPTLLTLGIALLLSASAAGESLPFLNDTIKIKPREAGARFGAYGLQAFAPEWHMRSFTFMPDMGVVYKQQLKKSILRVGFLYSPTRTVGEPWQPVQSAFIVTRPDSFNINGELEGSQFYAGLEKVLFSENKFNFYVGADVAVATHNFDGVYKSYHGFTTYNVQKKMTGIGINPFMGASVTIHHMLKVTVESGLDNWWMNETTTRQMPIPESTKEVSHSSYVVSAPKLFNGVTVTWMF